MGVDGARDKEWLRARRHHLCLFQTQFSSFFFFVFFQEIKEVLYLCLHIAYYCLHILKYHEDVLFAIQSI